MPTWKRLAAVFAVFAVLFSLPVLSAATPLTAKEQSALRRAKDWKSARQYPIRDGQSVIYRFAAGQPVLVCAPLELCIVRLEAGERVAEGGVHVGDAARWLVTLAVGGADRTHLIVKPVEAGLKTSLAVVTDRRTYYIRLKSHATRHMPEIAFRYPEQLEEAWRAYHAQSRREQQRRTLPSGQDIADLDFEYRVSGCDCAWKPLRVFNNGEQTVIQMPAGIRHGEYPALIVVGSGGENQLVNYRVRNRRYIVDTVFDKAFLVLGTGPRQERVVIEAEPDAPAGSTRRG